MLYIRDIQFFYINILLNNNDVNKNSQSRNRELRKTKSEVNFFFWYLYYITIQFQSKTKNIRSILTRCFIFTRLHSFHQTHLFYRTVLSCKYYRFSNSSLHIDFDNLRAYEVYEYNAGVYHSR